jgi:hypothetical protein
MVSPKPGSHGSRAPALDGSPAGTPPRP